MLISIDTKHLRFEPRYIFRFCMIEVSVAVSIHVQKLIQLFVIFVSCVLISKLQVLPEVYLDQVVFENVIRYQSTRIVWQFILECIAMRWCHYLLLICFHSLPASCPWTLRCLLCVMFCYITNPCLIMKAFAPERVNRPFLFKFNDIIEYAAAFFFMGQVLKSWGAKKLNQVDQVKYWKHKPYLQKQVLHLSLMLSVNKMRYHEYVENE